ncbi:hypothetical protein MPTK1_4g16070 [Marchantia polymorpha subsp. ruderalis]|uniref:Uncharacterized protein n=2 Tax=Marchantia polymorpha TaxID=3197 RepID=A0AAF6BAD9_MARPO|nr:hypothetical protein MARPO_0054s0072 [Marchantia polymorpha]BBN08973.1 hypothetical protein Mp_4g16070 [Marchantia polymorpha subsp. ruderalis]|eukprot:PTQ37960.1 hypothetical protein MARPO_0054s0072 [Marchantia polymorpha]
MIISCPAAKTVGRATPTLSTPGFREKEGHMMMLVGKVCGGWHRSSLRSKLTDSIGFCSGSLEYWKIVMLL